MSTNDLILDGLHTPTYEEIDTYINEAARPLWQDINTFIQEKYNTSPKLAYSKCSGKPGWNIKYKKSGKSLCTLYPEKEGFVVLVVIQLDMVPTIEALTEEFQPEVLKIIKTAKPFNGTLWLMIEVKEAAMLEDVKQLLLMKQQPKGLKKA